MSEKQKTFGEIISEYGLTEEQVQFYQQYSMERSCHKYEKTAVQRIGTSELISDWEYKGYYDSGYRGAAVCSNGHKLRYVHIARNKRTDENIKFGIQCACDFFSLTPMQMKFIKAGFAEANDEILNSLNKLIKWNGDFEEYDKVNNFRHKVDTILNDKPELLRLSSDNLENLLKIGELRRMINLRLFLPDVFERRINYAFKLIQKIKLEGFM